MPKISYEEDCVLLFRVGSLKEAQKTLSVKPLAKRLTLFTL